MYDITIIGGGIIGSTIAYRLSKYDLKVLLLEKNNVLANESTKGCTGIISNCFNLEKDSIKFYLTKLGYKIWVNEIFKTFGLKRKLTNFLTVALDDNELNDLKSYYNYLVDNKICSRSEIGITLREEILFDEPKINLKCKGALVSKSTWLIDPIETTNDFIRNAKLNNVDVRLNSKVSSIVDKNNYFELRLSNYQKVDSKYIINCSGVFANDILNLIGQKDFDLVTKKCEYLLFNNLSTKIKSIIFRHTNLENNSFVIPLLDNNILVGPLENELSNKNEQNIIDVNNNNIIYDLISELIPKLDKNKLSGCYSFPKETFSEKNDFVIKYAKHNSRFINVAGINFSGLTASPAIALYVEKLIKNAGVKLIEKATNKIVRI